MSPLPHTADLIIRASMGALSGLNELAPAFTRITGHRLIIRKETRDELEQRLVSNAPADLIVQTDSVMDSVVARGKVVAGSSRIFARAAVGLSVKSGTPRPDISTPEALKRTLLDARSICYSLGGSGIVAARAIEKLGIAGEMKSRTINSNNTPAAGYVARGETEMAIQQLNVSVPVAGTDYVGNLPGELHEYVVFAVAIMNISKEQEAAREFIEFCTSPQAAPLLEKGMMESAR
jgi:molybdate transport system substrate-binding protein